MEKESYLTEAYLRLSKLYSDPVFGNHLAQLRARAIQAEAAPGPPVAQFTFVPRRLWKQCDYIFSESSLLLREKSGQRDSLLRWIAVPARAFEFLAKFEEADDRSALLLNSAICYHIAGYQANAQCLSRLLESSFVSISADPATLDAALIRFFRWSLVAFIRRDLRHLQGICTDALSFIDSSQQAAIRDIEERREPFTLIFDLTAHAYFHQCMLSFSQYCITGNMERMASARESSQTSHHYFQQSSDATLAIMNSELQTMFDLFEDRSTWHNIAQHAPMLLDSPVWRSYLRNLAFENSIVEFWLSQLKAIQAGLLTIQDSFVIQMPTSAGKTLIAELAVLRALSETEGSRCLYIAPYRALVNEVEGRLAETLGAVGYRVSSLLGGFELDALEEFLIRESDVLVTTPEKADLFYRTHPEYFANVRVVVIDEGHILDEGVPTADELQPGRTTLDEMGHRGTLGRGTLLEFLVTRLKLRLPDARFVFLSAVLPDINAADFVTWLARAKAVPVRIGRTERPSRQVMARFQWLPSTQNGELEYIGLRALPDGRHPFIPRFLQPQQYLTGYKTPTGRPERRTWPDMTNKAQMTGMLAAQFARTGPVLVFCAQPKHVHSVQTHLITSLECLEASGRISEPVLQYNQDPDLESYHLAREWLGEDHLLTKGLHRGIAMHYGPLPDPVRQAIEDDFRQGRIQILVSTNTLGQGVNLPVRTAIIYSVVRTMTDQQTNAVPGEQPTVYQVPIKKRDFWNICGRAGRAGKETEGQIIFVVASSKDQALLEEYTDYGNLEEVESALYKLLRALVEARISEENLIFYLDSHILPLLVEEVVDTDDETKIADFLNRSLVGVQALRSGTPLSPLVSAIKRTAGWVGSEVPDSALRRVMSSTGLHIKSCQQLDLAASAFLAEITEKMIDDASNARSFDASLLRAAFSACDQLPEMLLRGAIEYKGPTDEYQLVERWVFGTPVAELRQELWNSQAGEAFGEYISDRLMYKIPWGVNGFLRLVAFRLGKAYEELPLSWQHLPSMVKSGLPSVHACWASSLGVSSRGLAMQLAERYESESAEGFIDFMRWLINLSPEFFLSELSGSRFEKRRTLSNVARLMAGNEQMRFVRGEIVNLESWVQGIQYEERQVAAAVVGEGDQVTLELEPENAYDANAVRVMASDRQIGFLQREKAQVVAREMRLGRPVEARVQTVRVPTTSYPYSSILLTIRLGNA
jgi:helicase